MIDASMVQSVHPVPVEYRGRLFKDWWKAGSVNDPEAAEVVRGWLRDYGVWKGRVAARQDEAGRGLVLVGPPGTGKTYLAAAILNTVNDHHTVAFLTDDDLNTICRGRRSYSDDVSEDEYYLLTRLGCVVVDDILRMGGRADEIEPFLRARKNNGLPTVITLNNAVEVADILTSFLFNWTWATFGGEDFRRAGR